MPTARKPHERQENSYQESCQLPERCATPRRQVEQPRTNRMPHTHAKLHLGGYPNLPARVLPLLPYSQRKDRPPRTSSGWKSRNTRTERGRNSSHKAHASLRRCPIRSCKLLRRLHTSVHNSPPPNTTGSEAVKRAQGVNILRRLLRR